jgi:hypothetical protein
MTITIYHNPACGTSRNVLAMIRNSGKEPHVIEYLKTPPRRAEYLQNPVEHARLRVADLPSIGSDERLGGRKAVSRPVGGERDTASDPEHPPKNVAAEQMMEGREARMPDEIGPHEICD